MKLLSAQLNLGFSAGYIPDPAFPGDPKKHVKTGTLFKGWGPARRKDLKDAITIDFDVKTKVGRRIEWQSVVLTVKDTTLVTENEIRQCIKGELQKTVNDAFTISITTDDNGLDYPVEDVTYVWYQGRRYCQHGYVISYDQNPPNGGAGPTPWWVVSNPQTLPDEPARITITLSWATGI